VTGLEREYARMERAAKGEDDAVFMRHDRRFHALIHECAGNKRLAEYVDGLRDLILMRGVITTRQSRTLADIVSEHRPILDSLRAGDPEGAAGAMKRHLVHTGQLMLAQEGGRAADAELPWADLAWPP
jgi:DNA-binding GntR family transcriptional regulator